MSLFNSRYGRGGGGMRLVIAAILAIVGLVTYFSSRQVNPVTGESQHVALSTDQEKALGLQSAPQMAQQMGGVIDPDRDPDARLVAQIGQRLVERSEARNSPYADSFRFNLLADNQTVNAFALPGGPIFITRALFERLENEAQVAGVLGHEIGHVINRHAAEHMATGQLGQTLSTAVGVAGSDRGQGSYALAQMVNQVIQLKYSREDELESDRYGLRYLVDAGYDPRAMIRVMEILKAASKGSGRGPDFMATHPHPEARIEGIQSYIAQNFPDGVPSTLTKGRSLDTGSALSQYRD